MKDNENEKDLEELKNDSLMWNEEDYYTMQKITGLDEESVEEDKRKGLNLIILAITCIVSLILGFLFGLKFTQKYLNKPIIYTIEEKKDEYNYFFTRSNQANEVYLYRVNSKDEETPLLNLTDSKYALVSDDEALFVLLKKDVLYLYKYTFTEQSYNRVLVKTSSKDIDAFYIKNGYILLKKGESINIYNLNGNLFREISLKADEVVDYSNKSVTYINDNTLAIYYYDTKETDIITDNLTNYLLSDNDKIFYTLENKLYCYSIIDKTSKELIEVQKEILKFIKLSDCYILTDGKSLYIYDNEFHKIKDFDSEINELVFIGKESLLIVPDDYDNENCAFLDKKYFVFDIKTRTITEKTMEGCLNTAVINDLIIVKQK